MSSTGHDDRLESARVRRLLSLTVLSYLLVMGIVGIGVLGEAQDSRAVQLSSTGLLVSAGGWSFLIVTALYWLVFAPVRARRPWGRVAGSALAALGIMSAVTSFSALAQGETLVPALSALLVVVNVLWLFAAWRRA